MSTTELYSKITSFLEKNGWSHQGSSEYYDYYKPSADMGFEEKYQLNVPIRFTAPDYNESINFIARVVADFYESTPDELFYDVTDYASLLKRNAVYMKLASREPRLRDHSINTLHVINVLNGLSRSYENYIKISFKKLFSGKFRDAKKTMNAANKLLEVSPLRIVDLEFQSFSFGVSVDTLMGKEGISIEEVLRWREISLSRYNSEVLNADFYSRDGIEHIKSMFDPGERKAIYEPIFKAINSNAYSLSLTDNEYRPQKTFNQVPRSTELEIIPPETRVDESLRQIGYYSVLIAFDRSTPLSKGVNISKKMLEDDLFAKPIDIIEIDHIIDGANVIKFQQPLKVVLDSDANGQYIWSLEEFDLSVTTSDMLNAKKELTDKILTYYRYWRQGGGDFERLPDYERAGAFFAQHVMSE
jgi:hypothetical protein